MKFAYRIVLGNSALADISTDRELLQGEKLKVTSGTLKRSYKIESVSHGLINPDHPGYQVFTTSITLLNVSKIS